MLASSLGPSRVAAGDVDRDLHEVRCRHWESASTRVHVLPAAMSSRSRRRARIRVPLPPWITRTTAPTPPRTGSWSADGGQRRQSISSLSRSEAPPASAGSTDAGGENGHPTTRNPHRRMLSGHLRHRPTPSSSGAHVAGSANSLLLTSREDRGSRRTNCHRAPRELFDASSQLRAFRVTERSQGDRSYGQFVMDGMVATSASRTPMTF